MLPILFFTLDHEVCMIVLKVELTISLNCIHYTINISPVTEMRLHKSEPLEGKFGVETDLEFEIDI